jgi:hypothetical protein
MQSKQEAGSIYFWLRIPTYLVLCFAMILFFSLPLFIIFPEWLGDYYSIAKKPSFMISSHVAMTVGVIVSSYVMIARIEGKSISDYFFTFNKTALLNGFAIGFALMVFFSITVFVFKIIKFDLAFFSWHIGWTFFLYLLVAVTEEVIFRGYILATLREKLSDFWALSASSILFGLVHFGNDYFTWIGLFTISLSGFVMGMMALYFKSISSAIGLHWSWNFFQGPVFGFAVSGHQETGLLNPASLSTDLLTGGKFGAEGSIILTSISIVFIGLVYQFYENSPNSKSKELP